MSAPTEPADVIVVGSGAAGMAAALAASLRGLNVVMIESACCYGGATAYSGGALWIPNSGLIADDTSTAADAYLTVLTGDHVSSVRRSRFIEAGPKMVAEFEARTTSISWNPSAIPDYLPESPGGNSTGRALEVPVLDARLLGGDRALLRPPSPATDLRGLPLTADDFVGLSMVSRSSAGRARAARIAGRFINAKIHGAHPLSFGQALIGRLRLALKDRGVPLLLSCRMTQLRTDDGRVTGVRVDHCGTDRELAADRGVVIATGGFSQNQTMRDTYLPGPTSAAWSLAPADGQHGDGIVAAVELGADVALMNAAWGMPVALVSKSGQDNVPLMLLNERALPGTIVVDQGGRRYANEAMSYPRFWNEMYAHSATVPSWLVFDQRAKNRYMFLTIPPRFPFPRDWYSKGYLHRAGCLTDLARAINVAPAEFSATIDNFNQMVRRGGADPFRRGESAYDRHYGDPTLPDPNLQPVDVAPFYAVPLYPGDLGTQGGLVIDEHSRVLRPDGSVIVGLYAAGNASAGVMGKAYPGPGATISAAMVAGYLAALDLAAMDGERKTVC